MRITKGGIFRFNPNKVLELYFDAVMEVANIVSRRLEDAAQANLADRMIGDKSSGALSDGIRGYVLVQPNMIVAGMIASALETGQFERSAGEAKEAKYVVQSPAYDYAKAVEDGSGVFAEGGGSPIEASGNDMIFWTGGYNAKGQKIMVRTPVIAGQPAKQFMEDAFTMMLPFIEGLVDKIGMRIPVERVTELIK